MNKLRLMLKLYSMRQLAMYLTKRFGMPTTLCRGANCRLLAGNAAVLWQQSCLRHRCCWSSEGLCKTSVKLWEASRQFLTSTDSTDGGFELINSGGMEDLMHMWHHVPLWRVVNMSGSLKQGNRSLQWRWPMRRWKGSASAWLKRALHISFAWLFDESIGKDSFSAWRSRRFLSQVGILSWSKYFCMPTQLDCTVWHNGLQSWLHAVRPPLGWIRAICTTFA